MRLGLLAIALVSGCGDWVASEEGGLTLLTRSVGTGPDGRWTAKVDVDDAEKLLLTAIAPPGDLGYLGVVTAPDGTVVYQATDWWDDPHSLTNAAFASEVVVAGWPIGLETPPLTPGTWSFELRGQTANTPLDVSLLLAQDDDFAQGRLTVEIVYADDLADEVDLVNGVEGALATWRDEVYGPIGIDVTFTRRSWDGPARLTSPGYGDADLYRDAVADRPLGTLTVLVIRQVTDVGHVLGVAGGIPGALVQTDRSVVTVSALESAGADLRFSVEEERLLAETLAHEVGHFLGLFHPVEIPAGDNPAKHWDALDDTPACVSFAADGDCIADLATNLMFPTPVCGTSGCAEQEQITAQQVAVMQRYVGVR